MEEADGRGESEGEATTVDGAESESQVVEVTVLRRAGLPLEGTAVEAIVRGGAILSTDTSSVVLVLFWCLGWCLCWYCCWCPDVAEPRIKNQDWTEAGMFRAELLGGRG